MVRLTILLVVLCACFTTARAEVSHYILPTSHASFGVGADLEEHNIVISGRFEYGINKTSKFFVDSALGLVVDSALGLVNDEVENNRLTIPPQPRVGLGMLLVSPLEETKISTFFTGRIGGSFIRQVDSTNKTRYHANVLTTSATGGLLTRLDDQSKWLACDTIWRVVCSSLDYEGTKNFS